MLGGPSGTGIDGVCFPVHNGWHSRDVSMAGVCEICQREFYNVIYHLVCSLVIVNIVR